MTKKETRERSQLESVWELHHGFLHVVRLARQRKRIANELDIILFVMLESLDVQAFAFAQPVALRIYP